MDQSSHNNQPLPGQQPQPNNSGSSYNTFINGIQNYANINSTPENNDFDFTTGWHSDLFNSNQNEALSSNTRQSSASPASYAQPAGRQAKVSPQPAMPQYAQQTQPFINTFQQQPYDSRQFVQPQYDPRFLQRPTQATNPYVGYQYPSNLNFGRSNSPYQPAQSPDLGYQSSQPYTSQSPALQAQPSQHAPSPYAAQSVHYPYAQQYAAQPSAIQPKLVYANEFTDFYNPQQASSQTVNPSDLTTDARNVGSVPKYQSQLSQNGLPAGSPYFSSPFMQTGQHSVQAHVPPQHSGIPNVGLIRAGSIPGQPKKPKDPNTPKKPRGRPRKDGTIPISKTDGQEASTTSDSDSDDENEPPDPKPALLVVSPPTDLIGRATYDAVAAVWSPQNKRPIWGNIIKGMALFADSIKSLRDAWKAKNEALKKAENSNSSNIQELRQDVGRFRTGVEITLQRALQFGHEAHLSRLGENVHLLLALNSFLLDRITATDFDGSLVLSILKLMARFSTMTEEVLDQTKVAKILQRLTKKGGTESKELAQKILAKAVVASKKKAEIKKPESPSDAVSSSVSKLSVVGHQELPTGLKRPRDGEISTAPAPKRVITKSIPQSSKPLAVQAAERRRAEAAAQVLAAKNAKLAVNGAPKAAKATPAPLAVASSATDKPKVSIAPPVKPTGNLFASLQSASKKPGTSNADRAAAAKEKPTPITKEDVSSSPVLPSKAGSSFSFSDVLADMSKPKGAEPKKVEVLPQEDEEQRAKRIRKEERRKLRVSWKPDDSLVETKIFTHDPEEEIGQSDNMRRDVGDVGGEGRMLKLHMDKKGLEDEEDEGDELEEYSTPTEVDFSDLPTDERERNFIKASGILKPESQAGNAQDIFEQNTLMVVHALPQDIPPSPKEPSNMSEEDDYQPIAEFGEPTEQTRARETQRRIASGIQPAAVQTPGFDINAIIQGLRSNQAFQQQQPSNNFGAFQPSHNQTQIQPSAPTNSGLPANLSSIIAAVQQAQNYQAGTTPSQAPNHLAAALAQFSQPQQQANPPLNLNGNANPYGTSTDDSDNNSRKHGRTDSADSYDFYNTKKQKPATSGQRGGGVATAAVATNSAASDGEIPYKYKTQVCSFFKEGKCIKGDQCTFIHDLNA